jgi:DNA-directed RNA polymerase subunit F
MKIVSLAEIKEMLMKLGKKRELTREQRIAMEHSEKVVEISAKQTKELIKRLSKVKGVNEIQAYKIADLLPRNEELLLAIFAKETISPSGDDRKKILEMIREYT